MMIESHKGEGSSERACPPLPCKDGETETQGGAGPQGPRFLLLSVQYIGSRLSPPSCTVSFVLLSLQVGEGAANQGRCWSQVP